MTDTCHTAIHDNNKLEMIYQLELAWDTLYVIDKTPTKTGFLSERVFLVSAINALKNEFGITSSDMTTFYLNRSAIVRRVDQ